MIKMKLVIIIYVLSGHRPATITKHLHVPFSYPLIPHHLQSIAGWQQKQIFLWECSATGASPQNPQP